MKKIFFLTFLTFLFCSNSYSNEKFNTWGLAGTTCKDYNRILNENPDLGSVAAFSAFQGFLTGYNLSFSRNNQKVLNIHEYEYIENYIQIYCNNNGSDTMIWRGLVQYFNSLPKYR